MDEMRAFVEERNRVFTEFVMTDDLRDVYVFCQKHGVHIPPTVEVLKAAVYKAVQECTDIPDDVKKLAREKCVALGFEPTMF